MSLTNGVRMGVLATAAWLIAGLAALAQVPKNFKPTDYVSDFAAVLSPSAKAQLSALCGEVDRKAGAQIAVVTVKSLDGRSLEDFSIDLATQLGVGPKQTNRGVLILLAVDDHKYRIEVAYGLESILPDGKVGGFGRESVPYLRARNYDAAVLLMTRRVAEVIAQDRGVTLDTLAGFKLPPSRPAKPEFGIDTGILIGFIIFAIWALVTFLRQQSLGSRYTRRGRGGGWWIGPMMGGWGSGSFGRGSWGGGFGGGGGGFGGFGGGSFGGGGASGSW